MANRFWWFISVDRGSWGEIFGRTTSVKLIDSRRTTSCEMDNDGVSFHPQLVLVQPSEWLSCLSVLAPNPSELGGLKWGASRCHHQPCLLNSGKELHLCLHGKIQLQWQNCPVTFPPVPKNTSLFSRSSSTPGHHLSSPAIAVCL